MDQDRLKELFGYFPENGDLVRKIDKHYNAKKGDVVGTVGANRYKVVNIDGKLQLVHRVIMTMVHGDITGHHIDHINGDRSDNRIANLRLVTQLENNRNSSLPAHNTSGALGVHWCKSSNKWRVTISVQNKPRHFGRYTDKEQAIKAAKDARKALGFHENHGKQRA